MKGSYLLLLRLKKDTAIRVGALGIIYFRKGYYCYVGSAMGPGGMEARIGRHLREDKSIRWHIDYLLQYARVEKVWFSTDIGEKEIARRLSEKFHSIPHFGSSDSPLKSHLFVGKRKEFIEAARSLSLRPFL